MIGIGFDHRSKQSYRRGTLELFVVGIAEQEGLLGFADRAALGATFFVCGSSLTAFAFISGGGVFANRRCSMPPKNSRGSGLIVGDARKKKRDEPGGNYLGV